MKLTIAFLTAITLALAACEQDKQPPPGGVRDTVNDALDRRPNEPLRDAAEDVSDAVEDAVDDVKDAVNDATE